MTAYAEAAMSNHCFHCGYKPCIMKTEEYDEMISIGMAMEVEDKPNDEIRYALYRHMSTVYHGSLGVGIRKELPACVVGEIHDAYPDKTYVGFKPGRGRGNKERYPTEGNKKRRAEDTI